MKSIQDAGDLKDKRAIVRVDFNVSVSEDGSISEGEAWRINASVPTIKYLLEKGASVILMTHFGRPEGRVVDEYKLGPLRSKFANIIGSEIIQADDCIGESARKSAEDMLPGSILLLENLRFHKEEEENNLEFAKQLASFGDIYVNDAFSVSHRRHASVDAITNFLSSYAGLSLEKEVKVLSEAISCPDRPATIIIGGLKAETKLPVINFLLNKFDNILVGGVVANFLIRSSGFDIGNSVLDKLDIAEAGKVNVEDKKIHIPFDVITDNSEERNINLEKGKELGNFRILDLGEGTLKEYLDIIKSSETIIWSGAVGMFEEEEYSNGTREIARAMAESNAKTIIGGGDTIRALDKFNHLKDISYISTGGGAMLEFLSGKKMPGIEVLNKDNV